MRVIQFLLPSSKQKNMECKKSISGWIKTGYNNRENFIVPEDICYCMAERSYSWVYLKSSKNFLVCKSLKELEKLLPKDYFLRCHRSFLINTLEIERIDFEKKIIYQKSYRVPFSDHKFAKLFSERPFGK